jgi:hypothetical protein
VKQIAHRIHEDHLWCAPLQWLTELPWNQPQIKALLIRVPLDSPESLGKRLCITMFAPRTNLRAPAHRIPRRIRPFNFRSIEYESNLVHADMSEWEETVRGAYPEPESENEPETEPEEETVSAN